MSGTRGSADTGRATLVAVRVELSAIENGDLAESTAELELEMLFYRAALTTTSRAMQPSLLDFLR